MKTLDAVVIGAGVFGAWAALHLRHSGRTVALVDIYGAGNSRSSSGGESRILRMGYGADEIYTRWAMRSRELWLKLFAQIGRPELFQNTGVLWTPHPGDPRAANIETAFEKCGVPFQRLSPADLARTFPQLRFRDERMGLYETQAGVIFARRAVQAVVAQAVREGVEYGNDPPAPGIGRASSSTRAGLGCRRSSPKSWAAESESRVRKCFSLDRPREIRASLRR